MTIFREIRASDSKKPAREDHVSREQLSVTTALQEADAQQTPTVSVSQKKSQILKKQSQQQAAYHLKKPPNSVILW